MVNNIFAQREVNVYSLSIEHGLSQSVVNDLLVDSKGFLWVGTQNGLNRFDGYDFKVFFNDPHDKYTISSDFVTCLAEDAIDNLWIGTRSGLNKYEHRTHRFIHYGLPSNKVEFPQFNVRSLLVDGENSVWVLLPEYLARINPVDDDIKIFALGEVLSNDRYCPVKGLYESSSSNIWFIAGSKLVMFDKVFEKFEVFDYQKYLNHACLTGVFESENVMFVTTDNAVYEVLSPYEIEKVFTKGRDGEAFTILQEKKQVFIVANDGFYQVSDGTFRLQKVFTNSTGVPLRNYITVAAVDSSDNLWIGTSGKGVLKTNITTTRFESITHKVYENQFLSDDQISCIWVDPDTLWIGTYEYGLNLVCKSHRISELISVDTRPDLLKSNNIYDIRKIGNRYIIATEKGFSIVKKKGRKLICERHKQLDSFTGHVYDILPIGDSLIYYSFAGRLFRYGLDSENLVSWMFDVDSEAGLTNSFSIEKVRDELIFVGTSYGLFRFDLRTEYWDRFLYNIEDELSIPGNDIYALDFDAHGRLWVGTSSGFAYVEDPYSKKMDFNKLLDNEKHTVYSIVAGNNYTWVGTGNGLIRYNLNENAVSYFTKADGLPCNEFNIGSKHHFDSSHVAFGGQGGAVLFNMDSVVLSDFNPVVEISSVVVYGRKGKRELPVYSGAIIDLLVSDFLVNIHFTALDHTSPEKNLYRYKINNSDWVDLGSQNYASFSNMQPGKYIIDILGTNSDRIWSDSVATLTLIVPSPWYISWWAYVIYALVLLVFILIGIETRTRHLRLTNQVLREKEASSRQVAKQKDRLSVLHKDLTESISYASRIQRALFPANTTFKRILPHSFVMHRPKDIISGDFYWVAESGSKVIVAVVDCTGHGVPGALMSVIGVELLKRIVIDEGYLKPSEILNRLTAGLYQLFVQDDGVVDIADGMDMGLCVIDREMLTLEYSGAIHSLCKICNNDLHEIKGDRMPVGMAASLKDYRFTNHIVDFTEADMFFMSTDGYPDQFGGKDNKKYKYNRFRNFLVTIAKHDLDLQSLLLENNFDKWRGSFEQVDDVLVVGFRPVFLGTNRSNN